VSYRYPESRIVTAPSAGGGSSLYDLAMETVDLTDGSWALSDPDSLIDTTYGTNGATFSGGFNTIQWAGLAVGNADYNWSSAGNIRSPRWYRQLRIDGNDVSNLDLLILTTRLEADTTVSSFNQQLIVGAALFPTNTVLTDLDGTGAVFNKTAAGNPAYGSWAINGATAAANAGNLFSVQSCMRGFDALGTPTHLNANSAVPTVIIGSGNRPSNANVSGSPIPTDAYLIVGFGPRGNLDTIPVGAQQRHKIQILAITADA
jgi:hypothetical protein